MYKSVWQNFSWLQTNHEVMNAIALQIGVATNLLYTKITSD
jgi:hypothetical protein